LEKGDLRRFGRHHANTGRRKKYRFEIQTNSSIDKYYQLARDNGCGGCKLNRRRPGAVFLLMLYI